MNEKEKLCPRFIAKINGECKRYFSNVLVGSECEIADLVPSNRYDYIRDKTTFCPHGIPQKLAEGIEAQKKAQSYWENVYKNNKLGIECKCGWRCKEVAKYCEKCGCVL